MDPETLAAEAERLLRDPVVVRAVAMMRQEALDDLVAADAPQVALVIRAQERVKACDEFLLTLRRYIEALPSEN